jgi:hypothetical protein
MGKEKSESELRLSRGSEADLDDFSHQGLGGKWVETGKFEKFSTFPQDLLLLLVLLVLHLI